MRFYPNAKCKIWNRACKIDSWQNQVFITRTSILIFVRVLENLSQRAYFWSCDGNTATPLADKREIGRFMGFPVPYCKILSSIISYPDFSENTPVFLAVAHEMMSVLLYYYHIVYCRVSILYGLRRK